MVTRDSRMAPSYSRLSRERRTSYSLWSRGRLLGQTELDYVRCMRKQRMGDLNPTELGEKLLPLATGVSRAVIELGMVSRELAADTERSGASLDDLLRHTTEGADFAAAQVHEDSLELELRGPDGSVVPTEWIDVRDTHYLLALAQEAEDVPGPLFDDEEDAELMAAIEHDEALMRFQFDDELASEFGNDEPWQEETSFPRYQIQVRLLDDRSIP